MPRPTVTGTPLYDLYFFIVPAMTFDMLRLFLDYLNNLVSSCALCKIKAATALQ